MDTLERLGLEAALAEEADLEGPEWLDLIESRLEGLTEAERISLSKALNSIGKGTQKALPGVVSGATAGSAAGPWGALIGGVAGGALSLAGSAGAQNPAGPTRTPRTRPARGSARPKSATSSSHPRSPGPSALNSDQAAAQLLRLVQDPRLLQALAALVLGSAGRRQVPAGRKTTASPAAFLNLLGVLAQSASGSARSSGESSESYLVGAEADAVDIASPYERAMRLWEELETADPETLVAGTAPVTAEHWLVEAGLAEVIP